MIASVLSTIIDGILLIGSILIRYRVTNPDARLGIVIGFVVLFAASLQAFTSATRDSILASTAAYAAVLVVFASGELGNVNAGPQQRSPT